MKESIFTKIIKREIPADIIWENEKVIVFMDAFPQVDGQILIVPKKQVDHFFDLDNETYNEVFLITKWVAPKLKDIFNTQRVVLIVEGFEVPHVHVKLFPTSIGHSAFPASNKDIQSRIRANAEKIRSKITI